MNSLKQKHGYFGTRIKLGCCFHVKQGIGISETGQFVRALPTLQGEFVTVEIAAHIKLL